MHHRDFSYTNRLPILLRVYATVLGGTFGQDAANCDQRRRESLSGQIFCTCCDPDATGCEKLARAWSRHHAEAMADARDFADGLPDENARRAFIKGYRAAVEVSA